MAHSQVNWHSLRLQEVIERTGANPLRGLTSREAERRLSHHGPNALKEAPKPPVFLEFLGQFSDFMILVLLVSAVISGVLGEIIDAATIMAIVLLNGILGFVQERRAERTMQALKQLAAPTCRVVRDGRVRDIPARHVVVGDVILFDVGDRIVADGRIIESVGLEVEESALTGESIPVRKTGVDSLAQSLPLGDRQNMVYMGTRVTRGRGKAIVVATGMDTEIGAIASLIQGPRDEETPLQRRLARLGRHLVFICGALCVVVAVLGVLRGEGILAMLLAGVTLAVAAIPEGLPAIVTICLALGVERMARRNAIIRKLSCVETLGCTTVICSDKTGTLTKNEMTLTEIHIGNRTIEVTGAGYDPKGEFMEAGRAINVAEDPHLSLLLEIGVRCNNAVLTKEGQDIGPSWRGRERSRGGGWGIIGDPTEGALVVAGAKANLWREGLARLEPWLAEIPFEPERKRMTVTVAKPGGPCALVKGAPDVLLGLSTSVLTGWRGRNPVAMPLMERHRREIMAACADMADRGLRVLGFAMRYLDKDINPEDPGEVEKDLTFVGVAGMVDPPREEVKRSVALATLAGIRTIMITGDHEGTARSVARSLGLLGHDRQVLTGQALDAMHDRQLDREVEKVSVFARVSPQHKLRIVRSLRRLGHVVAMTGDGVNDAPAVREADIGIAMGRSGTDVTREASAMVLADDNYATIVAAIEEGRAIYDNIRKFIRYLLGCNTGEILTMLLGGILGLPVPLVPAQILWMNLVTDGLPAVALGLEPKEPTTMSRRPRDPHESIFARGLGFKILVQGAFIGLSAIAVFLTELFMTQGDISRARTATFATLVLSQLLYVFYCKSETLSPGEIPLVSNPYLVGAVLISLMMQLLVMYVPAMQVVFHTCRLDPVDWALVVLASGWSGMLTHAARSLRRAFMRRWAMIRV